MYNEYYDAESGYILLDKGIIRLCSQGILQDGCQLYCNVEMKLCAPTTDGSTQIKIVELYVHYCSGTIIANAVVTFILKVVKFGAKAMKIEILFLIQSN